MSKQPKRRIAKAVVAAVSMCGLVSALTLEASPSAEAQLQLPPLPELPPLPGIPPAHDGQQNQQSQPGQPDQQNDGNGQPQNRDAQNRPPGLPPLPELPALPPLPPPPEVPENLQVDLTPPGPIEGERPVQRGSFIIKSDNTRLLGNVKMSLIQQATADGPKPALRIDADKAVLTNLSVQFPTAGESPEDGVWMHTGPGKTTTLSGNFHIVVSSLTVTPRVAGVPLIPLPIDANMAPKELQEAAKKLGLGTPDLLSENLEMNNGTMNTYFVKSDVLDLPPGTSIEK